MKCFLPSLSTDSKGVSITIQFDFANKVAFVNTSSGAGVKGFAGQAAYCASKWVIIGLSKAAALDYAAKGIRVNAVSPGFVATPMMERFTHGTEEGLRTVVTNEPVGRPGSPEELAATVLWLCSDPAPTSSSTAVRPSDALGSRPIKCIYGT